MTQIYITVGIIAIVAILVCYVFIRQTISERQREKARLQRVLDKRATDLLQMTSAFPPHFVPKELMIFIFRCIIDAYEQLTKLDNSNAQYVESLTLHTAQLENTIRTPERVHTEQLQSATQINELRQYLNLLNGFLQKSLQRQQISTKQYGHYRTLIKELIVRLAINNYMLSAKQALDTQKHKLALHYYDLAKKLLVKESPTDYQKNIEKINLAIAPLLQMEAEEEALDITEEPGDAASSEKEWDEFKEDDMWKKKNVYD